MQGMEWGYNMAGFYLQPEIVFAIFNSKPDPSTSGISYPNFSKTSVNSGAFLITIGRQMIFGDRVTFDIGGSIGYGFTNWKSSNDIFNSTNDLPLRLQYYGFVMGETGSVAFGFTMSMGILLK